MSESKIIIALDFPGAGEARSFYKQVDPARCRVKVGKELFTRAGPDFVRELVNAGFDVFLDLKFHDIPNTVAQACRAAADLGVWMLNVHAMGGRAMLEAAREGIDASSNSPLLIAVTILTSMKEADLAEVGINSSVAEQVQRLATLVKSCKLDGVVCSSHEVSELRSTLGDDFCLVTPGIRPKGSEVGDQKRIMTPKQAVGLGSSYLVIGRPITQAKDPMAVLVSIEQELAS